MERFPKTADDLHHLGRTLFAASVQKHLLRHVDGDSKLRLCSGGNGAVPNFYVLAIQGRSHAWWGQIYCKARSSKAVWKLQEEAEGIRFDGTLEKILHEYCHCDLQNFSYNVVKYATPLVYGVTGSDDPSSAIKD